MPTIESMDAGSAQPEPIGRSDHLHPFTTSSNATTTMVSRNTSTGLKIKQLLGYRNKMVGGGKLGKSTRGWATLPNNIIHKILDHVVEITELHWTFDDAWSLKEGAAETAEAITKRRNLSKLRLVSRGWKYGVESHSYWAEYTLVLDPSKYHSSTVADMRSSRTTPSTPSYPSLFHRARSLTLGVCLPCRLNRPDRLGLYPAVFRASTWSNYHGLVPTCHRHRNKHCSSCLREETENVQLFGDQVILQVRRGDLDERGRQYANPIVCVDCREGSLLAHIKRELGQCARGGPASTEAHEILGTLQAQEYLSIGAFNVFQTSRLAVRESWIIHHTVYTSLEPIMLDLQRCENRIKQEYIVGRRYESRDLRWKRIDLIQKLFDENYHIISEIVSRILDEMGDLYEEWNEEDDLEFEDDEDLQLCDLRQFWIETGQEAACYRWVRDRIRSGFWVSPSDELKSLLNPDRELHTPRNEIISSARLPLGILQSTTRPYDPQTLSHDLMTDKRGSFLPPNSIIETLDEMFKRMMYKILLDSCKSKVMEHVSAGYEVAQLEATRMDTKGMLEYLGTEEAWAHLLPFRAPISFPISAPIWGRRVSPEIEAIPNEEEEGDGFIVEVEEEDEESSILDEVEGEEGTPVSTSISLSISKESSQEPIMVSTVVPNGDGAKDEQDDSHGTFEVVETAEYETDEYDEDTGLLAEGRKRKSPPLPNPRPTKRRSSDEHHPSATVKNGNVNDGNEIEDKGDNDNEKNNDNDNDNENNHGFDKLPARNISEESLTSSDTQPITPTPSHNPLIERLMELRRKQRERAAREPRIAKGEVPHIPMPGVKLGKETDVILSRVYEITLDPFVCCKCGICMRG